MLPMDGCLPVLRGRHYPSVRSEPMWISVSPTSAVPSAGLASRPRRAATICHRDYVACPDEGLSRGVRWVTVTSQREKPEVRRHSLSTNDHAGNLSLATP